MSWVKTTPRNPLKWIFWKKKHSIKGFRYVQRVTFFNKKIKKKNDGVFRFLTKESLNLGILKRAFWAEIVHFFVFFLHRKHVNYPFCAPIFHPISETVSKGKLRWSVTQRGVRYKLISRLELPQSLLGNLTHKMWS